MGDERRVTDVLLERVSDPGLRDQLRRAIDELADQQPLGIVFEEHLPEAVRLPSAPIRSGVTVQYRYGNDNETVWDVRRTRQGTASISRPLADGTFETREGVPTSELIVARRLGDPIYPGFAPLGAVERGGDKPHHLVIQGENYHALQALQYTHNGKVDLIYIDPPYNTGAGDWIYNDRYVGDADTFRHSKWLSFMNRRLRLAFDLLAPTGVIIVAIDDNEHHRLRMLMDQVFGEKNFISNVVWQGGRKNDSRFVSNGADYMVIYARNLENMINSGVRWRVEKQGLRNAQEKAKELLVEHNGNADAATSAYRRWVRQFTREEMPPSVARYTKIEAGTGRLYRTDLDLSWPGGGGPRYDVIHPITGKPCAVPSRGWIYSTPERFQQEVDAGRVVFGPDESKVPSRLSYLDDLEDDVAVSVFESPRARGSKNLATILGSKDFPFPKDAEVLARWIGIATSHKADAIVLDFFAGTGTSAEAVMRLNAADGGRRQSIIVTNNELGANTAAKLRKAGVEPGSSEWEAEGVFEKVTRPRIETVVTGVRRDGSAYSRGLDENVTFLAVDYLDRDNVEVGAAFRQVAELLWAKAGAIGPVITDATGGFAATSHYAVCFDADRFTGFVDTVNATPSIRTAFVVASSEVAYGTVKRALREGVETVHLYENYLSSFEINTGAAR